VSLFFAVVGLAFALLEIVLMGGILLFVIGAVIFFFLLLFG